MPREPFEVPWRIELGHSTELRIALAVFLDGHGGRNIGGLWGLTQARAVLYITKEL